jgi:mono/diheme cytochrome c family protein
MVDAEREAIRRYVQRQLVDNPPPPLTPETVDRLTALLRPSTSSRAA